MPVRISHIPFYQRIVISEFWLFVAATAYALPVVLVLSWKPILAGAMAAAPIVLLLFAHGPSAMYVLVLTTFVFLPITGTVSILLADMAAFVLVAAYLADLLCRGPAPGVNRLGRPYLFYVLVLFIAMALEGFTSLSLRYFMRQLLLAGTFFAVAHFGYRIKHRDILNLFIVATVLNSVISLYQFLGAGGGIRAFGLAGLGYGDHAMLGVLFASVFYLWSRDMRAKIVYAAFALITLGALAATQTRASAITAGWGLILVILLSLTAGRRASNSAPRKNLLLAVGLAAVIVPILAVYTPIFEGVAYRFGRLGWQASGTILLRFSLWKAALGAFVANPILGIGPGNFPMVIDWLPEVRFDYVFYLVAGLSTHSVLMTTLAETGLVGLLALGVFFGRSFFLARRNFIYTENEVDLPVNIALLVATLAIIGSSLYAGSWFWGNNSYHMALVFGLIVSCWRR